MKIILSRKGFDSTYGKQPSPIMPDGTLLSLPIPYPNDCNKFSELFHDGNSYLEIIKQLKNTSEFSEKNTCHLDPDIRENVRNRNKGWKPLFGQHGSPQSHLKSNGVAEGDVFLFFGGFKQTELVNGVLTYKKGAPELHIIYGYLQIGKVHDKIAELPNELRYHPHAVLNKKFNTNINCIYQATKELSFLKKVSGAGCFKFDESLVLTQKDQTKSIWQLPESFHPANGVRLSFHPPKAETWKKEKGKSILKSARIGQEFIFTADPNGDVEKWCSDLIKKNSN